MEHPLRILLVTAELTPLARAGELGDVVSALATVLAAQGHDVRVVMPCYRTVCESTQVQRSKLMTVPVPVVSRQAEVWESALPGPQGAVPVYLLAHDAYFDRPGLYGDAQGDYSDNAARFIFFCAAVVALVERLGWLPEVIHCHDWPTALVPAYISWLPNLDRRLQDIATVYTVHTLEYQGRFPEWIWPSTGLPHWLFQADGLEFHGTVNFTKAGLFYADQLSTVSPTYAAEVCTPEGGSGLDGVFRLRRDVLTGILHGVDDTLWNPATDPYLAGHYNITDLSGKARCKQDVLHAFGLPPDLSTPLISMVTPLTEQKGIRLLLDACEELLLMHLRLAILGDEATAYAAELSRWAQQCPERISLRLGTDIALRHQLMAGSDGVLMPSLCEPCGLTQLHGLRYGTLPIVRGVGGLRDTVMPYHAATGAGTGFVFQEPTVEALLHAVRAALSLLCTQRETWQQLMRHAMAQDASWTQAGAAYVALYRRALLAEGSSSAQEH